MRYTPAAGGAERERRRRAHPSRRRRVARARRTRDSRPARGTVQPDRQARAGRIREGLDAHRGGPLRRVAVCDGRAPYTVPPMRAKVSVDAAVVRRRCPDCVVAALAPGAGRDVADARRVRPRPRRCTLRPDLLLVDPCERTVSTATPLARDADARSGVTVVGPARHGRGGGHELRRAIVVRECRPGRRSRPVSARPYAQRGAEVRWALPRVGTTAARATNVEARPRCRLAVDRRDVVPGDDGRLRPGVCLGVLPPVARRESA